MQGGNLRQTKGKVLNNALHDDGFSNGDETRRNEKPRFYNNAFDLLCHAHCPERVGLSFIGKALG